MSKNTKLCLTYTDFLGASALEYSASFGHSYKDDVCVYALSAALSANTATNEYSCLAIDKLTSAHLADFRWSTIFDTHQLKFVMSTSANYMCYQFKMSDITTESDNEPDVPYSYEEFFNDNVLNHMSASTAMQYKYIYEEYTNSTPQSVSGTTKTSKDLLINNFKTTNNLASDTEFVRSDYYKFFIPETDIVHNKSVLELNDGDLASVGNSAHASFNCLLFCVNKNYTSEKQSYNVPVGFTDYVDYKAIPISICVFSKDVSLAGNNVQFEPNLNGIVTVE